MQISVHAIERMRERFPKTSNWSEEILIRRVRDAAETGTVEDIRADGAEVIRCVLKTSVVSTTQIRVAVRDDTIVSIYA